MMDNASKRRPLTPRTIAVSAVMVGLFVLLPQLPGCASDEAGARAGGCEGQTPTEQIAGHTGRFWFVQPPQCEAGDGSLARPFNELQQGLDAAKAGDTIVLGDGQFAGGVRLPAGVNLVAATAGTAMLSGGAGLEVLGAGNVTVRGVRIDKAIGLGVTASGGQLRLEKVVIAGTRTGNGQAGHGIAVQALTQLTLIQTQVVGSEGLGVLARATGKVAIIEPIYLPSPRSAAGKFGIIEPIYQPISRIADNALGGIAIIEPIYSPAGSPNLWLESTRVTGNGGFGVGLWGASVRIVNSAIDATRVGAAGPWADGVMLVAGLTSGVEVAVQIDARSVIANNARTGVAMLGKAALQVGGDVSNNALCGIWAGKSSVVTVTGDALFGGNTLLGVAVTEGADLQLDGAIVRGTVAKALDARGDDREAGDGIGVFSGARATIRNARLLNNARAGVVVHEAKTFSDGTPDVIISGSLVTGGKYAVVVNGSPAPSFKSTNTYEAASADGNDSGQRGTSSGGTANPAAESPDDKTDADLPVKTQICDTASNCSPNF